MSTNKYHRHSTKAVYESVAVQPTEYRVHGDLVSYDEWASHQYRVFQRPDLLKQALNIKTIAEELLEVFEDADYIKGGPMADRLRLCENEMLAAIGRAVDDAGFREA
jgi:hypothetical protein